MSLADPETVYVAGKGNGGSARKLHTEEDCSALKKARTVFERRRGVYPDDVKWCKVCTGGADQASTQDTSHYNALKEAAVDTDTGRSGGDGR